MPSKTYSLGQPSGNNNSDTSHRPYRSNVFDLQDPKINVVIRNGRIVSGEDTLPFPYTSRKKRNPAGTSATNGNGLTENGMHSAQIVHG